MPFLVMGGLTVEIVDDSPREGAPEPIGQRVRTIDGRDAGYVQREIRSFPFTGLDVSAAGWNAIRAASPPGVGVTCSGDGLPAAGTYLVTRSADVEWDHKTLTARYTPRLVLRGPFTGGA